MEKEREMKNGRTWRFGVVKLKRSFKERGAEKSVAVGAALTDFSCLVS